MEDIPFIHLNTQKISELWIVHCSGYILNRYGVARGFKAVLKLEFRTSFTPRRDSIALLKHTTLRMIRRELENGMS